MNFNSREEIGLVPPDRPIGNISPNNTAGHWNGPSIWIARWGAILDHSVCLSLWRGIQSFHMNTRGWSDIAYGAGACPHGYVLAGRGPGKRTAANGTNHANTVASAVCALVGEGDPFTSENLQAMLDAWQWLSGGERSGHRDWFNTACPGDEIYPAYVNAVQPQPTPTPTPEPQPQPPSGGTNEVRTPTLRQGATGPAVIAMQGMLKYKGGNQSLEVDGVFGPGTDRWLRDFQRYYNVVGGDDGVCGSNTWQALVDV